MNSTVLPPDDVITLEVPGGTARMSFDDDAVAEAVWLPTRVVVRTATGMIVVRDRGSLAGIRRILPRSPAARIGVVADTVWVALSDGTVGELDLETGAIEGAFAQPGGVVFLGVVDGRGMALFQRKSNRFVVNLVLVDLDRQRRTLVHYRHKSWGHAHSVAEPDGDSLLVSWIGFEGETDVARIRPHAWPHAHHVRTRQAHGFARIDGRVVSYASTGWSTGGIITELGTNTKLWDSDWRYDRPETWAKSLGEPAYGPLDRLAPGPDAAEATVYADGGLFRTNRDFTHWTWLGPIPTPALIRRYVSYEAADPTVLHVDADGTVTVGRPADGLVVMHPDGSVEDPHQTPVNGMIAQVVSAADGVYATAGSAAWKLGDPGWMPAFPEGLGRLEATYWDADPAGNLRLTGVVSDDKSNELATVMFGATPEVTRVPIPVEKGEHLGGVLRVGDRVLLGGDAYNRAWDGQHWSRWPAAAWFGGNGARPLRIVGDDARVLDRYQRHVWRIPEEGGAWTQMPEDGDVETAGGRVVTDGCGRRWTFGEGITLDDRAFHVPGFGELRATAARPEGVAFATTGALVDLTVPCAR